MLEAASLANTPFFPSLTVKMLIFLSASFLSLLLFSLFFLKAAETFYYKEHTVASIPPPKFSLIFQHIGIT